MKSTWLGMRSHLLPQILQIYNVNDRPVDLRSCSLSPRLGCLETETEGFLIVVEQSYKWQFGLWMQTIRSSQKIGQLGGKEALTLERRNAQLECREALNCWLLSLGCVCRSLEMESDRWRKLDEQVQLQSKTFSADEYFAKWSDDMQPKYVWHSDSVVRIAHLVSHLVCCLVCCKITIIWFWPML